MIFTNSTLSSKAQKIIDFWSIFEGKFEQTSIKRGLRKRVFFECLFSNIFFRILTILAQFGEAPAPPKIRKNP